MIQTIPAEIFATRFSKELKHAARLEKVRIEEIGDKYITAAQQMQTGKEIPFKNLDNVFVIAYFNTLRKLNPEALTEWLNKISGQLQK